MSRRNIAIIAVSTVVVITLVTIFSVFMSPKPEPLSEEDATREEPTVSEGVVEGDHYDYEVVEPTIIQGKEVVPDEIIEAYIPLAETAAREYVSQNTKESGEERTSRLLKSFHSDSSAIYAGPPAVDKSGSTNTYSTPTILYNDWVVAGNNIIATISMRVDTFNNRTKDRVSRIYQVYDVVLSEKDGVYKAQSISFSNKPVVIGQ